MGICMYLCTSLHKRKHFRSFFLILHSIPILCALISIKERDHWKSIRINNQSTLILSLPFLLEKYDSTLCHTILGLWSASSWFSVFYGWSCLGEECDKFIVSFINRMFSWHCFTMDTNGHFLVSPSILDMDVASTKTSTTSTASFSSIHQQNGTVVDSLVVIDLLLVVGRSNTLFYSTNLSNLRFLNEFWWSKVTGESDQSNRIHSDYIDHSLADELWSSKRTLFFRFTLLFLVVRVSDYHSWCHRLCYRISTTSKCCSFHETELSTLRHVWL